MPAPLEQSTCDAARRERIGKFVRAQARVELGERRAQRVVLAASLVERAV
jgi:hypothetical protein